MRSPKVIGNLMLCFKFSIKKWGLSELFVTIIVDCAEQLLFLILMVKYGP